MIVYPWRWRWWREFTAHLRHSELWTLLFVTGLIAVGLVLLTTPPGRGQVPTNIIPVANSSADVAAAAAVATLPGTPGKVTYLCGFYPTGDGSTSATTVGITITGLLASLLFDLSAPAGATTTISFAPVTFSPCLPASAPNIAVVVTVPSLGTGNTHSQVTAWGFQQ